MLYIGHCEKILKYSYDTTKFLKKFVINNNNKNLINNFSISKINNTNIFYLYNLIFFHNILKKFLKQIKLAYVSIGVGTSLKNDRLINYQRTKKKVPILEDVIGHYTNFLDIPKTLGSKNNSSIIDTNKSFDVYSATGTFSGRSGNIYFHNVVSNGLLPFFLDLVNLQKNIKDKFQTPLGDLLHNNIFSAFVSNVPNFSIPNNRLKRSQLPLSIFSSLHSLLEPSTTTFSSLHSLLEPSTTTFSSLHSLLEPSLFKTIFSNFNSDILNLNILNKIFSNTINKTEVNPVAVNAATAHSQAPFYNNNEIQFQDKSHIFNNYFKDAEKALIDLDIVKENFLSYSTLFKNLAKNDNLNVKTFNNSLSKNLLYSENLSNNIMSKINNNNKILENIDQVTNTNTIKFMKTELKKDIKKLITDSNDFFNSSRTLLFPIQKPHMALPANNNLTAMRHLLRPLPPTMQNQDKSPRFQKYEQEEGFRLTNINTMKITHTDDLEKQNNKTKTIDDISSANNIVGNIDKTTNPKLVSLKYDIETVLSTELKRYTIQNNVSSGSNTKFINNNENSDTISKYRESYDYTINTLKKDLEDLFLIELRKHGVI